MTRLTVNGDALAGSPVPRDKKDSAREAEAAEQLVPPHHHDPCHAVDYQGADLALAGPLGLAKGVALKPCFTSRLFIGRHAEVFNAMQQWWKPQRKRH